MDPEKLNTSFYILLHKDRGLDRRDPLPPVKGYSLLHIAAYFGIYQILSSKQSGLNRKDSKGRTPLFMAVENRYEKAISSLIDKGARID